MGPGFGCQKAGVQAEILEKCFMYQRLDLGTEMAVCGTIRTQCSSCKQDVVIVLHSTTPKTPISRDQTIQMLDNCADDAL